MEWLISQMDSYSPAPSLSPRQSPAAQRVIERINPNLITRGDQKTNRGKHDAEEEYDESDGDDMGDHYSDKKKDKRLSRSPGKISSRLINNLEFNGSAKVDYK